MRIYRLLIIIAVVGLVFLLWRTALHQNKNMAPPSDGLEANRTSANPPSGMDPIYTAGSTGQPSAISNPAEQSPQDLSNAVHEYVQNTLADPSYDWKQPINFYGKVVDEKDMPLSGANVRFVWTDLSEKGTSEVQTTTDPSGAFLLRDQRGKRMSVWISKEGYYTPQNAKMSFEYANPADGLFTRDPANPVVFHLRKRGPGVDLITSAAAPRQRKGSHLHIPHAA